MTVAAEKQKTFSLARSRAAIQWLVAIGTFLIGLRRIMPGKASRGGSFDSFCAFGGIETLLPYIFNGHTLKSTNLFNFSILLGILGVALVAGRAYTAGCTDCTRVPGACAWKTRAGSRQMDTKR